jgi:hypothetical protein
MSPQKWKKLWNQPRFPLMVGKYSFFQELAVQQPAGQLQAA